MSEHFPVFAAAVHARFTEMSKDEIYVVDVEDIFPTYLAAFPVGTNEIFRERTEHDCSCCKNFVRNIGNVVEIRDDGSLGTIWDVDGLPEPYATVAAALAARVRQARIVSVFRTKMPTFGAEFTRELRDGGTHTWHHFHGQVASRHRHREPATARSEIESAQAVLARGLNELKTEALHEVADLIDQNAIYRGAEFQARVAEFLALKDKFDQADPAQRAMLAWKNVNNHVARFRNTVIGTLVQDISEGVSTERAVRSFESKTAPTNYKRPTALITPKMIETAVATLRDLGLESAVDRRYAKISDVSVNNVLFVDNAARPKMRDGLEGILMEAVKPKPVKIDNATKIDMETFLREVVPQTTTLEVQVENRHLGNFMSLTAPVQENTGRLFQWDNDFAWSYDGDVADSLKQRVKSAGGNVQADLRVSLGWFNFDDLDIHCHAPGHGHIYYGHKAGVLDVDMNVSPTSRSAVENLAFNRPRDGTYRIEVKNFTYRESIDTGFVLEVECNGETRVFTAAKSPRNGEQARCLDIEMRNGRIVDIKVHAGIVEGSSAQEQWGVTTQQLVPVETLLLSPNHWDGQEKGNKHWFFILKGCKRPGPARGIYNEFLRGDLTKHRKVFEVLGAKTKCPPSDEQLSGVGFSSTRGDSAVIVAKGKNINRAYDVQF
jgi:hypothetical protein